MEKEKEIHDESIEGFILDSSVSESSRGGIRTFFIFLDLPQHLEFRVGEIPLLSEGIELELEIALKHPRNPRKIRRICGKHTIIRRVLKYTTTRSGLMGLSQYLELMPVSDQK